MSTEPPWGGYPQQPEGAYPPGYEPAPTQPSYQPPTTPPGFAPPPPAPDYGQQAYPSQPLYPPPGQPLYPPQGQPLYPPPPGYGQPAYPSQPLYPPPPAYPSAPFNAPNMYVAQPAYPGMPVTAPDQGGGLAVAALVLGILSIPIALPDIIPSFIICNVILVPIPVLGIIFGALGLKSRQRHAMALTGLILSIIGIALPVFLFFLFLILGAH